MCLMFKEHSYSLVLQFQFISIQSSSSTHMCTLHFWKQNAVTWYESPTKRQYFSILKEISRVYFDQKDSICCLQCTLYTCALLNHHHIKWVPLKSPYMLSGYHWSRHTYYRKKFIHAEINRNNAKSNTFQMIFDLRIGNKDQALQRLW